jgi:toxin-antitoxin system PIN domain toxin
MLMLDVNILVYAHRQESPQHERYAKWLLDLAAGFEPFALSQPAMEGFIRVVTNPKIFKPPTETSMAFEFLRQLVGLPHCTVLRPAGQHWRIFEDLCMKPGIRGALIPDAAHAALAIETGCEWVSADTDFARFSPPLRWRHL